MERVPARNITVSVLVCACLVLSMVVGGYAAGGERQPITGDRSTAGSPTGNSAPSPCAADIDGDGKEEIICGDGGSGVRCFNPDGSVRWVTGTNGHVSSSAAAWDVSGDGRMEIFVGNEAGYLWGFDSNGRVLSEWGWPKHLPPARQCEQPGVFSSPSIGDIDGDGDMEVVVGTWGMQIWAFHYQGPVAAGFPIDVKDSIWSSPAIADINRDGLNEIVIGADCTAGPGWPYPSGGLVFVINGWGQNLPGWPKSLPQVIWSSPALADLNQDGYLDIIVGTGHFYQNVDGRHIYAWDFAGNDLPGWPVNTGNYVFSSPAVGDVTGDGNLEVVAGDLGSQCYVFSSHGETLSTCSSYPLASPTLGDVDGDGKVDIESNYYVGGPALGDFDKDGMVEIATWRGVTQTEAGYNPDNFPWPMFRHDCRHTGCYGPPAKVPPPPPNYETYILLQNANGEVATVDLTYMMEEGVVEETVTVEPESRKTIYVNESVGIGENVSTAVSSDIPIMAERAMYFNSGGRTGGHDSVGAPEPSKEWYLAEGYTAEEYDTWILVQNPGDQTALVMVTFMKGDGTTQQVGLEMAPKSRHSVHADEVPGFESCEVSTMVESNRSVIAERSMYFNYQGKTGGHNSIGVTEPSGTWYLAEGCTGWGFDTYVLVQNPGDAPADVTYTFMRENGEGFQHQQRIGPHSRYTVKVDDMPGLGYCSFSTRVQSSLPVCCERAVYFDSGGRPGGHNSIGTTSPAPAWYFAEGYTAEYYDTWILLQNPTDETAEVKATFMKPGGVNIQREYRVGPGSRYSIEVDTIPGLEATEVSTILESVNGTRFIAERAIYFNHRGIWPGGHDTMGVTALSKTWYFAEGYTGY
ncbi:MAG: VCBS repeat-containing protein [Actinobacteria bacterium]|nr:VCBS repeat-containing protein [Actinomycetota bacterium]